ncbi:galactonate dehydratase [Tamaricihabitans halophyticus]|uniref:Galactonate dehydratase n=1 Tax=Tamaricihabitans halophyticus TaxID=1262583 RepID=A0A4R2R3H5_9PSEU|nr:galactonate dehydratase [Tamaricihabitans halophyticus]TCP56577.1 galactonate dehydratase [Tamaricihabitans halophyticus]
MTEIAEITGFRVPPRWIFVRVASTTGAVGWGEAIVAKRPGAVLGAVDDLARNLVGAPANRIEDAWQRMWRDGFFRGGPVLATAAAAIEQALWDLKGKAHGLPVHEFLGGPVRDTVPLYAWIGGDRPADVLDGARARVEQGFRVVKMNATAELDYVDDHAKIDDVVARVASVRAEFGAELRIALDFHGRVHRAMAKALLAELTQFGLMWVEEPLAPGHEDALHVLATAAGGTPIATGERLHNRWEFKRLLESRVVDIVQPDVSLTGLFELEKICRMAEAYDVAVAPHCPNGPVSLAASLQVASCAGNVLIQEQSLGLHYNRGYAGLPSAEMHDYLVDPAPLTPHAGSLPVPGGAGLGIDLDERVVQERAGEWWLPDPNWRHPDGRYAEW